MRRRLGGGWAASGAAKRLRRATERAVGTIPEAARRDLRDAVERIRGVRSLGEAVAELETEVDHLLTSVVPVFVRYPAPLRRTRSARLLVAGAGLSAAAVEELSELTAVLSAGSTVPVGVPTAMAAGLAALAVEAYVATSLRVNDVRDAGLPVDPGAVAADVGAAMAGLSGRGTRVVTRTLVRAIVRRVLRRTGKGLLLPAVGAAMAAWDAQATVVAIRSMPLPDEEPAMRRGLALPEVVAHADWSVRAPKRYLAEARLGPGGRYLASAPRQAGPAKDVRSVFGLPDGGTALVGFDFPIGLPSAYAEKVGIDDFREALGSLGSGRWAEFFSPAREEHEIALERPFFPAGLAAAGNAARLAAALGLEPAALRRACDRAQGGRRAAAPLFLTQGQQQAGKAAIAGWRDVLKPSLTGGGDVHLWPFDGTLADLLERGGVVVAETYPAEVYGHLGLTTRSAGGKGSAEARRMQGPALIRWAKTSGVDLSPELREAIGDGFVGAGQDDGFDAVVGLFGMLEVLLGLRSPCEPEDPCIRRVEGWMLGLAVEAGSAPGRAAG